MVSLQDGPFYRYGMEPVESFGVRQLQAPKEVGTCKLHLLRMPKFTILQGLSYYRVVH
jgi:hypothetical protein